MVRLCEADKISYLANVFAICGADGSFAPQEVAVLKDVARRLDVSQEEVTAARNLVASGHYELALLSDSRARRDNIEDMVMAALADGELQPKESVPIEKFAKTLRFAQADMDMIARRAQSRLNALFKTERIASKKAQPAPPVSPPPSPAATNAAPAPSPAPRAAASARPAEPVAVAEEEPPARPAPSPPPVALPAALGACMRCRDAAQDQAAYCYGEGETLNVWGCRLLRQPWCAGAPWLKAGTFRPSGCFVFDREAIRALLARAAAAAVRCPYFDPDAVERALAALPSQAWPGRRWTLSLAETGEPGLPLTVRHYRHGCLLRARQRVSGVAPVGEQLARRIIRDARRKQHST
jgi:uncharacterized tellurite resistance protein B-like protein